MASILEFYSETRLMSEQLVHVLLVDDDEIDVEAVQRAFAEFKITNPITVARDGVEALAMLRGESGYDPLPRPYVILLDLNMPRMDGLEFLRHLRSDPELSTSIVFVLTTSKSEEDMVAAYNLHVAGYFLKSLVGEQFFNLPRMMESYWRVVEFPSSWS